MKILHNFKRDWKHIEWKIFYTSDLKRGSWGGFLNSYWEPELTSDYIYVHWTSVEKDYQETWLNHYTVEEAEKLMKELEAYTLTPIFQLEEVSEITPENEYELLSLMAFIWWDLNWNKEVDTVKFNNVWHKLTFKQFLGLVPYEWVVSEAKNEEVKKTKPKTKKELEVEFKILKSDFEKVTKELSETKSNNKKELERVEEEKNKSIQKLEDLNKKLEKEKNELLEKFSININTKKVKGKKRGVAWDDIIVSDEIYNKLRFSQENNLPLLLKWPSWTGKSSIIRALWEDFGQEVVDFNFNSDTTVEHLLGHKILVGGDMEWADWPLTDAVRNGKIFIGHEINASSAWIQFILNGLLEHNKWKLWNLSVQGNNWEILTPHPNFRFYWTYNPGYLGTKMFGTSIMSRFIGLDIPPLPKEEEKILLLKKYPWQEVNINILVEVEDELRRNKNFTYDVSTRDLIQCLMFTSWGFSLLDAIDTCITSSLQIDLDKKQLEAVLKSAIPKEAEVKSKEEMPF